MIFVNKGGGYVLWKKNCSKGNLLNYILHRVPIDINIVFSFFFFFSIASQVIWAFWWLLVACGTNLAPTYEVFIF